MLTQSNRSAPSPQPSPSRGEGALNPEDVSIVTRARAKGAWARGLGQHHIVVVATPRTSEDGRDRFLRVHRSLTTTA
ncbi:hypothetical protein CCP4SC76_2020030 [Gammaproteobacteria bacterium]